MGLFFPLFIYFLFHSLQLGKKKKRIRVGEENGVGGEDDCGDGDDSGGGGGEGCNTAPPLTPISTPIHGETPHTDG